MKYKTSINKQYIQNTHFLLIEQSIKGGRRGLRNNIKVNQHENLLKFTVHKQMQVKNNFSFTNQAEKNFKQ